MTFVVLAALAIVWVVVLGSYARERMGDRRHDSVSAFHSQLSTLQRTQCGPGSFDRRRGAGPVGSVPGSTLRCDAARIRRRNVLFGLLGAVVTTILIAAVATGVVTIMLAVVSVIAFTGYVALLVDRQRVIAEKRAKVRPIRSRRATAAGVTRMPDRRVVAVSSRR